MKSNFHIAENDCIMTHRAFAPLVNFFVQEQKQRQKKQNVWLNVTIETFLCTIIRKEAGPLATANFFMEKLSSRWTLSSNINECSCHCRLKFILVFSRSIVFFFQNVLLSIQITLTNLELADVAITTASSIVIKRKSVT